MADLNKIIDELSSLTVVEAAELSKQLEEKWGVTAAAAVAAAPAAAILNLEINGKKLFDYVVESDQTPFEEITNNQNEINNNNTYNSLRSYYHIRARR